MVGKISGGNELDVAAEMLKEAWPVIFNGNGYGAEWPPEAEKRGLHVQNSNPEAIQSITTEKSISLFEKMKVMSKEETLARGDAMHTQYAGLVEIELKCIIEMIKTMVLPASKAAGLSLVDKIEAGLKKLDAALHAMESAPSPFECSKAARVARLETMEDVRALCDEAE